MKRVVFAAAVVAALACGRGTCCEHVIRREPDRQQGTWCGGTLWKLMTLSDAQRWTVYPVPLRTISLPSLLWLRRSGFSQSRTGAFFEQQVWEMRVVIERYRLQSNGEIALELYDIPSSKYMNAYMPNPNCLSPTQTSYRSRILAARSAFTEACPTPSRLANAWRDCPAGRGRILEPGKDNPRRARKRRRTPTRHPLQSSPGLRRLRLNLWRPRKDRPNALDRVYQRRPDSPKQARRQR